MYSDHSKPHHMIRILAAYCCIGPTRSMGCVSRCVCVCGTKVSPTKTAEKSQMLFDSKLV